MQILKSFGCSFIFGSDLADDGRTLQAATPSQFTWPAHLSRHLELEYQCHARPGSGNLQILERLLNQIPNSDSNTLFVVGWTWIDRFDYYDANYDPGTKMTPWSTIMPIDQTNLASTYYKHLHSEYQDKFVNLVYIKTAIDALTDAQIPFLMTYMDRLLFDQRWHTSSAVEYLQQCTQDKMILFDGDTFLEWSRRHGYPESAAWHPLEDAHRAAANLLISHNLV